MFTMFDGRVWIQRGDIYILQNIHPNILIIIQKYIIYPAMDCTPEQLESKISQAARLKEEGNKYFKQKQYTKALRCYHQSNLYLAGLIDKQSPMSMYSRNTLDQQSTKRINELKFSIYMNMAQIYIFQAKYDKGLDILLKAAAIKENNKLKYRKAILFVNLGRLEEAKKIFKEVLEADPSIQQEVNQHLMKIKDMEKRQDQKAKKIFTKFFEKQEKKQENQ